MNKVCINIGHSNTVSKGASKKYCLTNESDDSYIFVEFSENDYNSLLALQLQKLFNDRNEFLCEIVMQKGEVGYKTLPDDINLTGADICVSLHLNAFNESSTGYEVLYYKGSVNGELLANSIQKQLGTIFSTKDRGIKPLIVKNRGGYLLHNTKMPCVIIEPGFISNVKDFTLLLRSLFDWKYANAIYEGIKRYFS